MRIESELAHSEMPHERAVPLGLVMNELGHELAQVRLPEGQDGSIGVSLATSGDVEGWLRVREDGVGLGSPRAGGSGMELVGRLVQQIGGRLEREEVERGTSVRGVLPIGHLRRQDEILTKLDGGAAQRRLVPLPGQPRATLRWRSDDISSRFRAVDASKRSLYVPSYEQRRHPGRA